MAAGQNLIEDEKAEEGGVKWAVYWYYAICIGIVMGAGALWLYIGYQVRNKNLNKYTFYDLTRYCILQGFSVGSSIWLAAWSTDPLASTDVSVRNKYLAVYGILGLLQVIVVHFLWAIL